MVVQTVFIVVAGLGAAVSAGVAIYDYRRRHGRQLARFIVVSNDNEGQEGFRTSAKQPYGMIVERIEILSDGRAEIWLDKERLFVYTRILHYRN